MIHATTPLQIPKPCKLCNSRFHVMSQLILHSSDEYRSGLCSLGEEGLLGGPWAIIIYQLLVIVFIAYLKAIVRILDTSTLYLLRALPVVLGSGRRRTYGWFI